MFCSSSIDRSSSPTTSDFGNAGVAHVRLNRAIEIVIDSIQSLEGAVNNFDQLVFGLIYGRLSSRTEFESIEVNDKIPMKYFFDQSSLSLRECYVFLEF